MDGTFEPVWWTSTFRRSRDGASVSGSLARSLKLGGPSRGDQRLLELLAHTRRPGLTTFARGVTRVAGGLAPYPVLASVIVATTPVGQRREAVAWGVRRLGSGLLVRFALAQSLRRARPERSGWLASSSGFSWPSGHTTAVTLTAGLAAEAARGAGLPLGPVLGVALPVPVVIGWSRTYLGVHWPSDVLAGWLLGLALLPLSNLIPDRDPVVAGVRALLARRATTKPR